MKEYDFQDPRIFIVEIDSTNGHHVTRSIELKDKDMNIRNIGSAKEEACEWIAAEMKCDPSKRFYIIHGGKLEINTKIIVTVD